MTVTVTMAAVMMQNDHVDDRKPVRRQADLDGPPLDIMNKPVKNCGSICP